MTPAALTAWREARSLTRPQLAALLGVSREGVWLWEKGSRPIPPMLPWALKGLGHHLDENPDVGPELIRNPGFTTGTDGWT